MAATQTDIKFWLAKKCKQFKIYRWMCDVYREACFSEKIFTNGQNMAFLLQEWVEKTVYGVKTHSPIKKKD